MRIPANGQLAITEVMSEAVTTSNFKGPDFWELTNFGTNQIDLDGYEFCDSSSTCTNIQNLVIRPRESVVFVRVKEDSTITNRDLFMEWWGPGRFRTDFQVYFYLFRGFNAFGDELRLKDALGTLVDRVSFGVAQHGFSFTYDRVTGRFGVPSVVGQSGAWRAAASEDVAS